MLISAYLCLNASFIKRENRLINYFGVFVAIRNNEHVEAIVSFFLKHATLNCWILLDQIMQWIMHSFLYRWTNFHSNDTKLVFLSCPIIWKMKPFIYYKVINFCSLSFRSPEATWTNSIAIIILYLLVRWAIQGMNNSIKLLIKITWV